jgi:hypothetical protein
MAVGTSDHKVQIWDVEKLRLVRCMLGHHARVSSLAWNGPLVSSGGRDTLLLHHDVRIPDHRVGTLRGHTQEVCGLKWAPSGTQLASGGNDNILNIWDERYTSSAQVSYFKRMINISKQPHEREPHSHAHSYPLGRVGRARSGARGSAALHAYRRPQSYYPISTAPKVWPNDGRGKACPYRAGGATEISCAHHVIATQY